MKKITWIIGVILLWVIWVVAYIYSGENMDHSQMTMSDSLKSQKTYEHTFPEQVVKNDFFAGEFIRNDVASIYPRRESLVKDILVDIWDEVYAGQTLAILFEPGVEGQSASNIWLKSTIVNSQEKILWDTQKIADSKISEFDKKIEEKEIILRETLKNYDLQIRQIWNTQQSSWSEYSVGYKNLITLENSYENALDNKAKVLSDANSNIDQKTSLFDIKIKEVYSQIIPMIYIWEENNIDYEEIKKGDLHYLFSSQDSSIINSLVMEVRKYQEDVWEDITERYENIKEIIRLSKKGLENTPSSVTDTPQELIDQHIVQISVLEAQLETSYEWYTDAKTQYEVIASSQNEKLDKISDDIEKQKESLELTASKYSTVENDKQWEIEKLTAELETLKASRGVLIANQEKQVTQASNNLAIARADLNKEYVASWDYKIISPFSGVISSRNMEIGEMISPSMEAYRVSGVDNSLSRITKKEIKFFVPESLQWKFQIGQEVYFSSSDEAESFSWSIYRISPEIDEQTRSITIQAKVDESISLSNKSTIRVSLETQSLVYKVPTSSIYNKWERTIVYYKKDNEKLGVKDIVILSDDGEFSLVTGDFDSSLKVVTTPIFIK